MTNTAARSRRRGRPIDPQKDKIILAAARTSLLTYGSRAMMMDAVAAAARVFKATLYSRHASRKELLPAVVGNYATSVARALIETASTPKGLSTQLCNFVADLTTPLCGSHHRRMMQALSEEPQRRSDLRKVYRSGLQHTIDALAHGLQAADACGLIRCEASEMSAEILLGMAMAMAMGMDLVRAQYGDPLARRQPAARRRHKWSTA